MTLAESLGAFPRYMNRPLARVHVYSWRLAVAIEPPDAPAGGIRYKRLYRSDACKSWRKLVADELRRRRKAGTVMLPYYAESIGGYSKPWEGVR